MRRVRARCAAKVGAHRARVWAAELGNTESGNNWPGLTGGHRAWAGHWSNVKIAVTSLPARIISGLPGELVPGQSANSYDWKRKWKLINFSLCWAGPSWWMWEWRVGFIAASSRQSIMILATGSDPAPAHSQTSLFPHSPRFCHSLIIFTDHTKPPSDVKPRTWLTLKYPLARLPRMKSFESVELNDKSFAPPSCQLDISPHF